MEYESMGSPLRGNDLLNNLGRLSLTWNKHSGG